MARRIRSLKPELLDDEKVANLSDTAFRVWVACVLTSDDFGTFRADPRLIDKTVYWAAVAERSVPVALGELQTSGMVRFYSVRGQTYGRFVNWKKHQRVDNAGKTGTLPGPEQAEREVYFTPRGGQNTDPPTFAASETRLAANATYNAAEQESPGEARGSLGIGGDRKGEEHRGSTFGGQNPEAARIEAEIRRHPVFDLLDASAIAVSHAGRMAVSAQPLANVLAAIDECSAKSEGLGLNQQALQGRLVGFMRNAKPPRSSGPEGGSGASGQVAEPLIDRLNREARETRSA
jgi:hypothetical protein